MSKRVTLRHQQLTMPERLVHFYDGFTRAKFGVVDDVLEDWQVESVWRQGYNTTLDGRRLFDTIELFGFIDDLNQPQEEQVEQEGIDSGGFAPDTNRIRKSQPKSRVGVSEKGLAGSVSGGTDNTA